VPVAEASRVGPIAWRLDLDEAGQGIGDGDGVVGTGLQVAQRRLSDRHHGLTLEAGELCHVGEQSFQGTTKLVFRFASDGDVVQLRLGVSAEPADGGRESRRHRGKVTREAEVPPNYQSRQNW
jgi:hypothetical protein